MSALQLISIIIEATIAILGVKIATQKKKDYGWFITLTFGIYVFYDLAQLLNISVSSETLRILFFIATLSIFAAVWQIYKKK